MNNFKRLSSAAALLSCAIVMNGCGDLFSVRVPMKAQLVQGGGLVGSLLDLSGVEIPVTADILGSIQDPGITSEYRLTRFGLRSVLDNAEDKSEEMLKSEERVAADCSDGRPPITWIHSLTVRIYRQGDDTSGPGTVLVNWQLPKEQWGTKICGVFIPTESGVNLKDFLPDYQIRVEAKGNRPTVDTYIGGFTTITVR